MERVELCSGGPRLSPIVAGAWRMAEWGWDARQRLQWIEQCLELGVTSFDHADLYGGYAVEGLFGEALALAPHLRERLQIVSKCAIQLKCDARPENRIKHYDTSAEHITRSVENSLRALGTDHLDLLLIHRPDPLMDADVAARTFTALHAAGKVCAFGVSNFSPAQFELLNSRHPLATNQIECHPLHLAPLTNGTLEQCQRLRLRPMICSPLAGGALLNGIGEAAQRVQAALRGIGQAHGVSPATVAIAWLLRHPSAPLPITGSRRIESIREAVAALNVRLDVQQWTDVWSASTGREVD